MSQDRASAEASDSRDGTSLEPAGENSANALLSGHLRPFDGTVPATVMNVCFLPHSRHADHVKATAQPSNRIRLDNVGGALTEHAQQLPEHSQESGPLPPAGNESRLWQNPEQAAASTPHGHHSPGCLQIPAPVQPAGSASALAHDGETVPKHAAHADPSLRSFGGESDSSGASMGDITHKYPPISR
jgi:hypothetical protein